jgi:polyhydroxyalkanoate synthesis regulator phasin
MAMDKIGDGLKKFLLAGIGAAAVTVEKSQQIIDELVKKGEITVEQGKELNKELQHNVKKTFDARKAEAETLEEKIAKMGADELEALKKVIHSAEDAATKAKETAAEKIVEAVEGTEEEKAEAAEEAAYEDDLKEEGYMPSSETPEEE